MSAFKDLRIATLRAIIAQELINQGRNPSIDEVCLIADNLYSKYDLSQPLISYADKVQQGSLLSAQYIKDLYKYLQIDLTFLYTYIDYLDNLLRYKEAEDKASLQDFKETFIKLKNSLNAYMSLKTDNFEVILEDFKDKSRLTSLTNVEIADGHATPSMLLGGRFLEPNDVTIMPITPGFVKYTTINKAISVSTPSSFDGLYAVQYTINNIEQQICGVALKFDDNDTYIIKIDIKTKGGVSTVISSKTVIGKAILTFPGLEAQSLYITISKSFYSKDGNYHRFDYHLSDLKIITNKLTNSILETVYTSTLENISGFVIHGACYLQDDAMVNMYYSVKNLDESFMPYKLFNTLSKEMCNGEFSTMISQLSDNIERDFIQTGLDFSFEHSYICGNKRFLIEEFNYPDTTLVLLRETGHLGNDTGYFYIPQSATYSIAIDNDIFIDDIKVYDKDHIQLDAGLHKIQFDNADLDIVKSFFDSNNIKYGTTLAYYDKDFDYNDGFDRFSIVKVDNNKYRIVVYYSDPEEMIYILKSSILDKFSNTIKLRFEFIPNNGSIILDPYTLTIF